MIAYIKIKITKFVSNNFPEFVECSLVDADNKQWIIIEKIPVISEKLIKKNSTFPQEADIAVEILKYWTDKNGRKLVTINTENPWGIKSVEGVTNFDVYSSQIINGNDDM